MSHSALRFIRQQGWLVPEDEETVVLLRQLGISVPRLHERYVPLLRLAIGRRPIKGKVRPFREVEDAFHEALGAAWQSRFGASTLTRGHIVLRCAASNSARKAIDKVETRVREFAARWGLSVVTQFSETATKFRYTATYKFSADLVPLVPYSTPEATPMVFDLGFTRIELTFDVRRLVPAFSRGELAGGTALGSAGAPHHLLRILVQAGDNWVPVHTASFVDKTIGSIQDLVRIATELACRHNNEV